MSMRPSRPPSAVRPRPRFTARLLHARFASPSEGFSPSRTWGARGAMDRRVPQEAVARLGVTVHVPPALRTYTHGQDEVLLEAPDVAALLQALDSAFPGFRDRIVDEAGRPRPYVNVFVNENLVREAFSQVRLSPGDAVHILPSVAGGSIG